MGHEPPGSQLNVATPLSDKSTVEQIRDRFDHDVERFSNLQSGQSATIDAPLAMDLITQAALATTHPIRRVLDVGCGAGNNVLKLREAKGEDFDVTLVDLSQPMLDRAQARVLEANGGACLALAGDIRRVPLDASAYDVVLAAAVLHHLRDDADWRHVFERIHSALRPGGSVWVTDLVAHENTAVQELMWSRYGDYLVGLGGEEYRDKVYAYIDLEDSPRPVTYQLDLLRSVGFSQVELLHKNSCFAAFGAVK